MSDLNLDLIHVLASSPIKGVFLDIGANHGRYARYAASQGLTVYAFEPDPDNLAILRNETKHFGPLVNIEPVALSMGRGTARLYLNSQNDGGHTISTALGHVTVWGHDPERFIDVPTISLDGWIHDKGFTVRQRECPQPSDLAGIKIDVEAAELEVVIGAYTTLKTFRPDISLETHSTVNLLALKDLLLDDLGYTIAEAYDRADHPLPTDRFKIDGQYLLVCK